MKFSWDLTNSFLKTDKKSLIEIEKKLILSGLEIENVEKLNGDVILDLSITTNRKEINCAFGLAREISILTNENINIKKVKFSVRTINQQNHIDKEKQGLKYIRIHIIESLYSIKTPKWICEKLEIYGINKKNSLHDIKEYIRIKWGQTFAIVKNNELENIDNTLKTEKLTSYKNCISSIMNKVTIGEDATILMFATTQNLKADCSSHINNIENFYENYYIDTLRIISTVKSTTIGKYYENYESITLNENLIEVKRSTINQSLGRVKQNEPKFVQTKHIISALNRINLSPIYLKRRKSFLVSIPRSREHDLTRSIDVIEEIGKIYEFKYFKDHEIKSLKKGNEPEQFIRIKNIRKILRDLGISEVITCSLIKGKTFYNNSLKIYNPVNRTQRDLRDNLLSNLLDNYEYNFRYCNQNLSTFEVGKVFSKVENKESYIENKHLAGLISENSYVRKNWVENPGDFNIFHMKGIIEMFILKTDAEVYLDYIPENYDKFRIIKKANRIGVYDLNTKTIIGILGEIDRGILTNNQTRVYAFEINLSKFINKINRKNHLKYTKEQYSKYPSITRDISIKVDKKVSIREIYEQIIKINKELTESVEAFNEYTQDNEKYSTKSRFVGVRITYRSNERTLNNNDINNIDTNLEKITDRFNRFGQGKT